MKGKDKKVTSGRKVRGGIKPEKMALLGLEQVGWGLVGEKKMVKNNKNNNNSNNNNNNNNNNNTNNK